MPAPAVVGISGAQHARPRHRPVPRRSSTSASPELGIDFSVVYPSVGLVLMHLADADERRGACRALNRFLADAFDGLGDRLCPVAAIPMHTPDEAIAALDHAVGDLGFKAVVCAAYVQRPAQAVVDEHPDGGALGAVDGHLRRRQCVRLRPGVGAVPRPGREPRVPLRRHGVGEPHLDLELHAQPPGSARRGQPRDREVAVPRRRHPPLPRPRLRVPRGRRRLGGDAALRPGRPLGEAQRRRARAPRPVGDRRRRCSGELTERYGSGLIEIASHERARRGEGASTAAMRGTEDPAMLDEWAACRIQHRR